MTDKSDIGLIGLAVMGQNLILNMNDHGFRVTAYNRTTARTDEFLQGPAKDTNITGADTLQEFVDSLSSPRKIFLMVRAGQAVDATIESLLPLLDDGDVIIDGGNSNYQDTRRRHAWLTDKNILFIGTGVSGGEEGARRGPSIMPGGNPKAWPLVKDILQKISAKTADGKPCCDWVGEDGAGHFVKMVHNGIEYGDMQLIAEAYHYMRDVLGKSNDDMHQIFSAWNNTDLGSYLIEITADILAFKDQDGHVLDIILDKAGQKGTGKWTGINALELGIPLTLIGEAVFARALSALKDERVSASKQLQGHGVADPASVTNADELTDQLSQALLASKIISYAQGYMLLRAAAEEFNWDLQYGNIAQMWREGCIIRSVFLDDIQNAFAKNPDLSNLLLDDYFAAQMQRTQPGWRKIVASAVNHGTPMPAMSSALAFYDGYRSEKLPANMIQAQRDYFGAHTYERVDRPRGEHFHTDWTGEGGDVSSTTYDV